MVLLLLMGLGRARSSSSPCPWCTTSGPASACPSETRSSSGAQQLCFIVLASGGVLGFCQAGTVACRLAAQQSCRSTAGAILDGLKSCAPERCMVAPASAACQLLQNIVAPTDLLAAVRWSTGGPSQHAWRSAPASRASVSLHDHQAGTFCRWLCGARSSPAPSWEHCILHLFALHTSSMCRWLGLIRGLPWWRCCLAKTRAARARP